MRKISILFTFLLLTSDATCAPVGSIKQSDAYTIEDTKSTQDIQHNGSIWIKNSQLSNVSVNGDAVIENSTISQASISGAVTVTGSALSFLRANGDVGLAASSKVDKLTVAGGVTISNNSAVKSLAVNGSVFVDSGVVGDVQMVGSDFHLWNSPAGAVNISYNGMDTDKPVVIKCMGRSTIDSLTVSSQVALQYPIVIVLDDISEGDFDKSRVFSKQSIKYTKHYP